MPHQISPRIKSLRPLHLLLAWFVLNLVQAALTPLDPDETYYWMYAGRLAWGYFDHPPAVAVLISIGKDWLPGSLGLRFGHVLCSTATIAGMWHLLGKPAGPKLWLAAALVFAQPFLNVYGFIATPDGPLLLFTVLYLLAYRRFLGAPTVANGALWGLMMAGLLYGKYHGVMLIFFSVLPHLVWLLRKPGAWVAALGGAALFLPHLYWQYANDFPSFRYHLSGRDDLYQLKFTTEYLLNQLVIFSPLLLPVYGLSLWHFRRLFGARPRVRGEVAERGAIRRSAATLRRAADDGVAGEAVGRMGSTADEAVAGEAVGRMGSTADEAVAGEAVGRMGSSPDAMFLRANLWLIAGFFVFFLYTTTKGGTEAQWTALLSMPLCYLSFRWLTEHRPDWIALAKKLGLATIVLLTVARLLLMAPREWLPFDKPFDHQPWTERLAEQADGLPVVVQNSYRFASLYEFYTGNPAWTFTDVQYRLNQYDLWTADSAFHNQSVYLLGQGTWNRPQAAEFRTQKRGMLAEKIDSFQVMKGTDFYEVSVADTLQRGQPADFAAIVSFSLPVDPQAGNLPLQPFVAIHYPTELRFWTLDVEEETVNGKAPGERLLSGTFRVFKNLPVGPAELEFGYGYAGMPPLRGQSTRIPVYVK